MILAPKIATNFSLYSEMHNELIEGSVYGKQVMLIRASWRKAEPKK